MTPEKLRSDLVNCEPLAVRFALWHYDSLSPSGRSKLRDGNSRGTISGTIADKLGDEELMGLYARYQIEKEG